MYYLYQLFLNFILLYKIESFSYISTIIEFGRSLLEEKLTTLKLRDIRLIQ